MKNIDKQKRKQDFGKLISGTSFEQYAVENNFINDNKNFIEKKTGSSKFNFTFIYNNEYFGVWSDFREGKFYISHDYNKNCPFVFATTLKDHTPNTMFLSSCKKYNCWKQLIENYKLGNVRFENMKIKNIANEVMKMLLTK